MGWGQWTGQQTKAHKEETHERGMGNRRGEKLRGERKGATIREEDRGVISRHDCAAGIDAERWVWHVVIIDRRMAAAEHCRRDPEDDDPDAPVKVYPRSTGAMHPETLPLPAIT
jgi:hypothetical protein